MSEPQAAPDVLIVEDSADLADILTDSFRSAGCTVRAAHTGAGGLQAAHERPPDLVLLDLGLPDLDGLSVCRAILALRGPRVIVITGRDDPAIAQAALDLGADDYVRKPFHLNELTARVHAVMRRGQPDASGLLKVGRLLIDRNRCLVNVEGREVALSATELRLLSFLAERPGWVFSKEQLLDALWPDDRDAHAVQVHLSNLRRKIEAELAGPPLLVTLKGLGYKLEP